MLPSLVLLKNISPSSRSWLARQSRDHFVKERAQSTANYRSRSAFKLLDIDKTYRFLQYEDVRNGTVVDLGAAPGGWSQVVAEKMGRKERAIGDKVEDDSILEPSSSGRIIAIDLLRIPPLRGVETLQLDFLSQASQKAIESLLAPSGKADVILSDMAANTSGNRTRDIEASLDICTAVYTFAERHLRTAQDIGRQRGGVLLMKHFTHPLLDQLRRDRLEHAFREVKVVKPPSSRSESSEAYWVCMGWKGVSLFRPSSYS